MACEIVVVSQQPPGGRCTLYTGYAQEIADCLNLPVQITYCATAAAHGEGYPSLLVSGVPLQPADGAILAPEDICAALVRAGIGAEAVAELSRRMEERLEQLLQGA